MAIDPAYLKAHNNLGVVLEKKGRLDEAIAQFQAALELEPDYVSAQNNLAQVQAMVREKATRK